MLTLLLALSAQAGDFPYPVHTRTLENGCTAVVVPMPSKGVVSTAVWMSVGSRNEVDRGRTGFAHFFEHLMFTGTESMDGSEREKALLRLGIGDNAWTWLDETVYTATVDTRSLDAYLAMEADLFANLKLRPEDVRKEAGAVYGEFRKSQSSPEFRLDQATRSKVYRAHTYAHDALGLEADIAAMPDAHSYAMRFFSGWYRPENATVILVGDVEPDAAFAMVEAHFAGWAVEDDPATLKLRAEPEQMKPKRAELSWPTPTPPLVQFAWRIPAYRTDDPDTAALSVIDALLLGPTGSLKNRLVREEALAIRVRGGAEENVDPGMFVVMVQAKQGADRAKIEAIVQEEILSLVDGIDAERLERTRSHQRYATLTGLDDPDAVVNLVGSRLRRGADPEKLGQIDTLIAEVDSDQVAEVVGSFLIPERRTTVWLSHTPETPDAP